MHVTTSTLRGRGVEMVEGGGTITSDKVHFLSRVAARIPTAEALKIRLSSASVSMSLEEIRLIVEFLRSNGIEIDPMREKQRKVAWVLAQSFGPVEVDAVAKANVTAAA